MSGEAVNAMADEIDPWELHSELVLVSPAVCTRALELLPERDPDAFLTGLRNRIGLATAASEESDQLLRAGDALR